MQIRSGLESQSNQFKDNYIQSEISKAKILICSKAHINFGFSWFSIVDIFKLQFA